VIIIEILINKSSGVPMYIQVKKQIMDLIRDGSLKIGTKMPTERELSEKLKISRNTISAAYKELEQEGVLKSYQGRGTFVAEEARPWKAQGIKDKIVKFIDLSLEEALETGMGGEEFLELVGQRVKEKLELMTRIVGVYVECNIEQSRMFSKQLSERTNMNMIPLTVNDLKNMDKDTKDTIEKTQVIIATFNHVNEVNELIGEFNKEVLGVAINADLETIVKIARYPEGTKFGFVCISEEFMFKIRGALEKAGLGNIDIEFTNSTDEKVLKNIIKKSNVIIVSPGRYKDIRELSANDKEIIQFLYSLDDGSVKALKSKIIELKYQK
jgi:DNA-binding transcriptional regulator YhcF (GntR family)